MVDAEQNEQEPDATQGGAPPVRSGVESPMGAAGAGDGAATVDVSGDDLDVEEGPRQESGSPLEAEQYDEGAADLGGTGGVNAGGAG